MPIQVCHAHSHTETRCSLLYCAVHMAQFIEMQCMPAFELIRLGLAWLDSVWLELPCMLLSLLFSFWSLLFFFLLLLCCCLLFCVTFFSICLHKVALTRKQTKNHNRSHSQVENRHPNKSLNLKPIYSANLKRSVANASKGVVSIQRVYTILHRIV